MQTWDMAVKTQPPPPLAGQTARAAEPMVRGGAGFVADWRHCSFLHFAFEPADLAPHVPLPLDLHEGRAYVSLVFFTMERVRLAGGLPAALSRLLLRPVSDHFFLNVRTYVRGPAGPGIHFLAEWIANPLSLRVGPWLYGLPYRAARFCHTPCDAGGQERVQVTDRQTGAVLRLAAPTARDRRAVPCERGSATEFLLERYTAYTHRRGITRYFRVRHAPWRVERADGVRFDLGLAEAAFPWFRQGEYAGAQVSDGVRDVEMGWPHHLLADAGAPALPNPGRWARAAGPGKNPRAGSAPAHHGAAQKVVHG